MNTETNPSEIASVNPRTLEYRLEHKYNKSTKLDILRKMSMQINRSYKTLQDRGVETNFTEYYEKSRVFSLGMGSDKIYSKATDDELDEAIMKAQHMYNMQTRNWSGELQRRKHSIERLYLKLNPKGSLSSSDYRQFKKAIGFAPSAGRYANKFFQLLNRATDSIHDASVYYKDGRGGVMGAIVREMTESGISAADLDYVDWNKIIDNVNQRLQQRGAVPTTDPDEDFNA